jgi:hypothetical protein
MYFWPLGWPTAWPERVGQKAYFDKSWLLPDIEKVT